ncbi:MAG: rhombosortase [Desulfuromonadales bacterium GWD2_61_12]|nr:MAG: rhombosortase [Desulfuromonadales bacterium GWC2_61_20]OGR34630.1 MAG: rhombosortase [Desulfuromonadales bacterium GWD2_61_12]HBT83276.1 rhombosortase [Desulfuromonas sp.]
MPDFATILPAAPAVTAPRREKDPARGREIYGWLGLLLLANIGLLLGNEPTRALMFDPAAIAGGEWWRVATWPWAHVSRYHLLLDGVAFLLLYRGLEAASLRLRLGYLLAVTTGSLLLPLLCDPEIARFGLCGLSGPAHGLLAISALELCRHSEQKQLGVLILAGLVTKTAGELYTGTAFLQQWHFGDIGVPIVATHAGGLLAGLLAFVIAKSGRAAAPARPSARVRTDGANAGRCGHQGARNSARTGPT